jgi:hypothetical protein
MATVRQSITLQLNSEEAQLLSDLLGMGVIGAPCRRRRVASEIFDALTCAGFECTDGSDLDFEGSIRFKKLD